MAASPSPIASSDACMTAPTPWGSLTLAATSSARCQHDASLAQLAGELDTTIDVVRRLLNQAGIQRSPRMVRSARQRRRTTDQRLTQRAAQLGFVSLHAYLADRVTRQAWPLTQIAEEIGVNRDTVRDRLDRHGLRR